ncbi:unnamed protein product, partial [marine sediment metagenome]
MINIYFTNDNYISSYDYEMKFLREMIKHTFINASMIMNNMQCERTVTFLTL